MFVRAAAEQTGDKDYVDGVMAQAEGVGRLRTRVEELEAEVARLQEEDEIWDKTSLVEIVTERDELRAEVEQLRQNEDAFQAWVEGEAILRGKAEAEVERLRGIVNEAVTRIDAAWGFPCGEPLADVHSILSRA